MNYQNVLTAYHQYREKAILYFIDNYLPNTEYRDKDVRVTKMTLLMHGVSFECKDMETKQTLTFFVNVDEIF